MRARATILPGPPLDEGRFPQLPFFDSLVDIEERVLAVPTLETRDTIPESERDTIEP